MHGASSGLSPPVAAIIAAGVAAGVTLASQFVANALGIRRDRKNQRRERVRQVVLQAARALYVTRSMTEEEFEVLNVRPDSLTALAPDRARATHYFGEAWSEALWELQIELGEDDPLIESYVEVGAIGDTGLAFLRVTEGSGGPLTDERKAEPEESYRALRAAAVAREDWTRAARARLAGI